LAVLSALLYQVLQFVPHLASPVDIVVAMLCMDLDGRADIPTITLVVGETTTMILLQLLDYFVEMESMSVNLAMTETRSMVMGALPPVLLSLDGHAPLN
jgi:hypothetical protein